MDSSNRTNTTPFAHSSSVGIQNKIFPYQRMLFPVHVYVHYTDTLNYYDRVMQIKRKLTDEPFFSFPVTCTTILAIEVESELGLLDVYVIGGHKRYRLSIVEADHRLPTLVEVVDTIGWAAMRNPDPEMQDGRTSIFRKRSTATAITADATNSITVPTPIL